MRDAGHRHLPETLPRVSTAMSLHLLACNLKPMISIFGIAGLLEAIRVQEGKEESVQGL